MSDTSAPLRREIGLWQGVALNMIDMVGIGPFITIPLILSAMGGGRAIAAWILGALLAICDGLVTAELAAELPASGGSYVFLREAYGRETFGRLIAFLFLFQVLFSAPLSIASACIGFVQYLSFLLPTLPLPASVMAAILCALTTLLLLRRIGTLGRFSVVLWGGVLATLALVIVAGLPHIRPEALLFWKAPAKAGAGWGGLGAALIFAVYDYLGYYNICYLGDEIREPTRTIPRVIVISILAIGALYLVMNVCVVSVLPMKAAMTSHSVISDYLAVLLGGGAARVVTLLILWTAFASLFSVMLGYSRVLYAAGRDGNFFGVFGRVHEKGRYPYVAVLALGGTATLFCFLPLRTVLVAILSIRAIIPFLAQIAGAILLRRKSPGAARPFRMWLYPLPALVAAVLWVFVVVSPEKGFQLGGLAVIGAGTAIFLVRSVLRKEWPFARAGAEG
jgi:basic amino acid/polyamine antiporter, APA family